MVMPDRYLIVNADDFGISRETNDVIERLFDEGRITSTTIMVPGAEFDDAAKRAARNKKINVGLHVTLNSDFADDRWKSIAAKEYVKSLLDDDGYFYHDTALFYKNAAGSEVALEINAQYDAAVSARCAIDHVDSHCGTLYGLGGRPFIREALGLCLKHNLPFRFPKLKGCIAGMFGGRMPPEVDKAHSAAVMLAKRMGIGIPSDIISNPYRMGEINGYDDLRDFYINAMKNIGAGITEMFLHPSECGAGFLSSNPEWGKRIWEYEFLMSDDFIGTVEREGIILVSWGGAPFARFS